MAKKFDKDSFSGTLIVVLVVSLICSIIVAGAVVGLKLSKRNKTPRQTRLYLERSRFDG